MRFSGYFYYTTIEIDPAPITIQNFLKKFSLLMSGSWLSAKRKVVNAYYLSDRVMKLACFYELRERNTWSAESICNGFFSIFVAF